MPSWTLSPLLPFPRAADKGMGLAVADSKRLREVTAGSLAAVPVGCTHILYKGRVITGFGVVTI